MDLIIQEFSEEVNLTIIEYDDTLEFSIQEYSEEVHLTINEFNGADGKDGKDGLPGPPGIPGPPGPPGAGIHSVQEGDNITIDNTDPLNPVISAEMGEIDLSGLANKDASNIDDYVSEWRTKLGINGGILDFPTFADFPDTGDSTSIYKALDTDKIYVWDVDSSTYKPAGIDEARLLAIESKNMEQDGRLTTAENDIDAEIVNRALADNALQSQITTEKNRNDTQDGQIASEAIKRIEITTTTSISTNTLGTVTGKGQHGRHTQIKNGVHAINIECRTDSAADFMSSGEHLGSADITFVAGSGATVTDVYGGNKVLKANGTYTITRNANNYNLRISNP